MKCPGATWTLPSCREQGVYPVVPKNADWYVDKGRKNPSLRVKRRQLPLAPAFAITAHASQGQTLKAAIVDLMLGKGTSSITAYVAMTRVCRREDLLVYRPFVRSPFTGGPIEGPKLLMKQLRGEHVDWQRIEKHAHAESSLWRLRLHSLQGRVLIVAVVAHRRLLSVSQVCAGEEGHGDAAGVHVVPRVAGGHRIQRGGAGPSPLEDEVLPGLC